jgi:hypothetical protein
MRLTEDELTARVYDIKRSREKGTEPAVERQIIVQGQWLVDRIRNPVNDLISINPDAVSDLDFRQRQEVLTMLTRLQNRIGELIRKLGGAKIVEG